MKYRWLAVVSVVVLVITFGGGLLALRGWYRASLQPPAGSSEQTVLLRIEPGMSSADVAYQLKKHQLIRSRFSWRWYVFSQGLSIKLQAGLYSLHGGLSVPEIADIMSKGDTQAITVTLTSGMRLSQIKALLEEKGFEHRDIEEALSRRYEHSILADKPASASLEGYLFADTYRLELDRPIIELVDLMIANSDQKITPKIRQAWASEGLDLHQGLTLASIVQKEVANEADQKQVAQVFLKRLQIGMKLEADPTFEYAAALLGVPANIHVDSPFNTYVKKGIPPTPIATIELSAAEAVAFPADTNWLYFLSDRDGVTHFTESETEHNQNIEKYLR